MSLHGQRQTGEFLSDTDIGHHNQNNHNCFNYLIFLAETHNLDVLMVTFIIEIHFEKYWVKFIIITIQSMSLHIVINFFNYLVSGEVTIESKRIAII